MRKNLQNPRKNRAGASKFGLFSAHCRAGWGDYIADSLEKPEWRSNQIGATVESAY